MIYINKTEARYNIHNRDTYSIMYVCKPTGTLAEFVSKCHERLIPDEFTSYEVAEEVYNYFTRPEARQLLRGSFTEGDKVLVNVGGKIAERRVYYSKEAGDLYITVNNRKYFYCEFMED